MRKLILLVLMASAAFAQTAINDTLYLQSAAPWTGQITVSWPAFTNCAGTAIAKGSRVYAINAGVVSITLYATDCASPSIAYAAVYRTMGGADHGKSWSETWTVPSSPSIVTLATVRQSSTLTARPSAHASTHASAGSDPVTPAAIGAEPVDANIVRKDGNGSVAVGCTIPAGAPAGSGCFGGNIYIRTSGTTPGFDSYDGNAHFDAPSVSAGSYTILVSGIAASTDLVDAPNLSTLTGNQTITGDKIYSGTNTYQGVQDASGAAHTMPVKTGAAASKPSACSAGEIYFGTDSTAGRNLFLCTTPGSPGTWTQLLAPGAGGGGGGIARFGGSTAFTTTTWLGFGSASGTASTQSVPSTGETYTDLYCSSSAAPGAGASWVFAFNTNNGGADTAMTCTISGTETKCTHTGQTITTTAAASPTTGSMLGVHAIASTGPAPTTARLYCSAKYQ